MIKPIAIAAAIALAYASATDAATDLEPEHCWRYKNDSGTMQFHLNRPCAFMGGSGGNLGFIQLDKEVKYLCGVYDRVTRHFYYHVVNRSGLARISIDEFEYRMDCIWRKPSD